jgi:type II secretory pathway component HofQ
MLDLGTVMKFTPRVTADRSVTLLLDIVDSRLGPENEGAVINAPTQGEPVRLRNIENNEIKTTLHIADGETMVVGSIANGPKLDTERVALVTVQVVKKGEGAKAGK